MDRALQIIKHEVLPAPRTCTQDRYKSAAAVAVAVAGVVDVAAIRAIGEA